MMIYGDSRSGNCLKVRWVADLLGIPYDWIEIDVTSGATRKAEFLARNPAGQAPTVLLADGRPLAQSNAIILHLAEGSRLIPADAYQRARMLEWMFWEQYSHEPYVAVARFQVRFLGRAPAELEPQLVDRGVKALQRLETGLEAQGYLAGEDLSLADVALVAYTRVAHEGGFDLAPFPRLRDWIGRVEAALGLDRAPTA